MPDLRTDYERIADSYDEDREQWPVPRDGNIDAVPPGGRVLDLGCGTGTYLAVQSTAFGAVRFFGADPSAAMLVHARAKIGAGRLVRAGAEGLPFADASFAYVTTHFTFHHFVDKHAALRDVVRLLGPHGRFRMVNVEPYSAERWWPYVYFDGTRAIDERRFWPPERIADTLGSLGCDVRVDVAVGDVELVVADVLADAERRVVSQLAVLDDDRFDAGVQLLRAMDPRASVVSSSATLTLTATKR